MTASSSRRRRAAEAGRGLLGHLQIVVIEADEAEAERHRQHDPDIGVERIGPEQGRHHEPGQDHQPAHGGRALLGDDVRLRAVGADRLALALPQPQMIDDPGAEQEHEQRAGDDGAAGAEGDVAEHVQAACAARRTRGEMCWKSRSASKTFSFRPNPRLRRARSPESAFPARSRSFSSSSPAIP